MVARSLKLPSRMAMRLWLARPGFGYPSSMHLPSNLPLYKLRLLMPLPPHHHQAKRHRIGFMKSTPRWNFKHRSRAAQNRKSRQGDLARDLNPQPLRSEAGSLESFPRGGAWWRVLASGAWNEALSLAK